MIDIKCKILVNEKSPERKILVNEILVYETCNISTGRPVTSGEDKSGNAAHGCT